MTQRHPLLEKGMVVWKGKDHRGGFCYYTVREIESASRCICSSHAESDLIRLGFEVTPHWTADGQRKGYKAIRGLKFHSCNQFSNIKVHPVALAILNNGEVNNKSFKNLLSLENE